MRLVLDTNTAISGLLWGGTPGRLIDAAVSGRIELAASIELLRELEGVLLRDKFASRLAARGVTVRDVFDGYAALVRIVAPAPIPLTVVRDPDDDQVIAAAVAARADLIVSGDDDLLELGSAQGIPILAAAAAVERCGLSML